MNRDSLCLGCMLERGPGSECVQCGYHRGTPPDSSLVLRPGTMLNGSRYLIGRKLGQGGFGVTYIGYDFETDRRLAIKEYFPREISTRSEDHHTVSPISRNNVADLEYGLRQFKEEANKLASLEGCRNVVPFLGFFDDNKTSYLVMSYVEGDTLRKYLSVRGEKIPFEEALNILSQVMNALEDIHKEEILHRDISPENIYIERDGAVKVLDFGAAKQALGEQSQSFSLVLRPHYAPEEQYRRKGEQGAWTDIYALGATFYRSITGKVPSESLQRRHEDDLEPPRRLGVVMPAKSEAALLKALAVLAKDRFRTVAEFRAAITPPIRHGGKLSKPWLLSSLIALLAAGFALSVGGVNWDMEVFPMLGLLLLMMFLFHQMWKAIQDGHARMTPQLAVGLSLIPIFNWYWALQVVWGFAVDYNRHLDRHKLKLRKLPEGLFLAASAVWIGTCVVALFQQGWFGFLICVNAVFLSIVVARTCDAVNGLGSPSEPVEVKPDPPQEEAFSLHGLTGEYEGLQLPLGQQPVILGRSRTRANLVFVSDEISATHASVWGDASRRGVWVEDLQSMNGTTYREGSANGSDDWVELSGRKLLSPGDCFQLSQRESFEVQRVGEQPRSN